MNFYHKKIALILVLCFLTIARGEHHSHEPNHPDPSSHSDSLSAYDHHYHDYHHHHPVVQPNCGQICPKSLPRFKQYEMGQVYTVAVEGQTLINIKEGQTLSLKTKVDIHALSPCEFQMHFRDSEVSGVPNPMELAEELNASPGLRFGAHDGKIMGVCPTPEEKIWTLNVKKAILSVMQMTTKDLSSTQTVEEVDFSGHCTTTYRPLTENDEQNVLLEKTKNLNKCHLRRKNNSGFNSKSLSLLTEFLRENLPILKSSQRCLQEIKNGHPISVNCTEEQTLSFKDISLVKSTLSLKFAGKALSKVTNSGPIPQSAQTLLMSREDDNQIVAKESDISSLLKDMCTHVSGDRLSPIITEMFHSLVRGLRTLADADTRSLDKAVKSGQICQSNKLRDLFIAASAFAATDASINTIINAYNNKELTETQNTILLSLVALKTKPSEKTIEQFIALIQPDHSPRSLIIGISLMIRNLCKRNENCENTPAVKKTIDALIEKLEKTDCNLERITSLKALQNIKVKSDESVKRALLGWVAKSEADSGVRIAAIQALQSMADDGIRQKLIEILLKDNEPIEVRLTAYRTVVLSGATAEQLETIKSENDFQIQNYIRTHIRNLKKSLSADRRALLPQNAPQFEEPKSTGLGVDRNVEWNYRGITIEYDVIHPKGSMIPSLYTFSVWFPVGGKDLQLLEIQIRQKGLDIHVNKLLSKGFGAAEILMQLSEEMMELLTHLKDPNHKHNTILQVSVRMSGRNILFVDTFEDIHALAVLMKERMKELYNKDSIDMARALALLDSEVEVPSLNGFPMTLHLNETIVLAMKADHSWTETGGTRRRTIRSSRTYLDELSAGLNLKVRNYRPGFTYSMRFEMTPSSDAQVERVEGRMLKARINLPNERKSLLKISQSIRLIDGMGVFKETNELSRGRTHDDNTRCRQLFGINMCRTSTWFGDSPLPNVEYYMTKMDPTVDHIDVTLERSSSGAARDLMQWSAKVKAGKREYLAQLEVKVPKDGPKKANIKLMTPLRTITADASLANSADGNVSKMDLGLKVPNVIDITTKYNVERKGESDKAVDVLVEYQLAGSDQKETFKWNRKSSFTYKREKKTKVINVVLSGELMSTQFPKYNTKFSYYTSLKPYQNSKTEATVQWGQQLKDRVHVSHTSKMDVIELKPFQMVSENEMRVEATPLDINYNFKLNSDISTIKSKPKVVSFDLIGTDVEGRPNRDIKGILRYERMEQPIQQVINASLTYPGRDITYYSEVKQTKDLTYVGKTFYSLEKGKVGTIVHKASLTNPTKAFHLDSEADVTYSWLDRKYGTKLDIGWKDDNNFEFKFFCTLNGQKHRQYEANYDRKNGAANGHIQVYDKQAEFQAGVDSVFNPTSAQWGMKSGVKSYKFSANRVPKESITLKLDSSENSKLKEFKMKVSKKERSTLKMALSDGLEVNTYVDLISRDKRAHLDFKCPTHHMDHSGDIIYHKVERKLTWESKTEMHGKPYLTIESQYMPNKRSYFILKKIKGPEAVSKVEYFQDKGVYGAVVDTRRYSAILEGENRDNKRFGKIGFVDKVDNFEHKSHFNLSNGVLTVRSISDKEKETHTKLDAIIGCKIISEVTLISPKINAHLIANPLGEKKTLVVTYTSPVYEHKSNVEWVPKVYLKLDSLSESKVEPKKMVKVDAYLTRQDEATVKVTAPSLDIDIKRVKTPKPHFVFNTTINGYNEIQEYESNPSLTPTHNLLIALRKFMSEYFSNN